MSTALVEFLDAHRAYPWPDVSSTLDRGAPAMVLYEAYVASLDEDRRVLTSNEFAAAVMEAGYRRDRTRDGHFYVGLAVPSRVQRAREVAVLRLRKAALERARAEHEARRHPDGFGHDEVEEKRVRVFPDAPSETVVTRWRMPRKWCECETPQEVRDQAQADAEADEAGIAAIIEAEYGPYLAWSPGDMSPKEAAWLTEVARRRAADDPTIEAEVAQKERTRRALDWAAGRLPRDPDQVAADW